MKVLKNGFHPAKHRAQSRPLALIGNDTTRTSSSAVIKPVLSRAVSAQMEMSKSENELTCSDTQELHKRVKMTVQYSSTECDGLSIETLPGPSKPMKLYEDNLWSWPDSSFMSMAPRRGQLKPVSGS